MGADRTGPHRQGRATGRRRPEPRPPPWTSRLTRALRSLIVGPDCDGLRRTVGPLAWAAFEVLTARAEDAEGERVASISVRGLAAELAVATDTAARSLAILRSEGLIAPRQGRGLDGQFAEAS